MDGPRHAARTLRSPALLLVIATILAVSAAPLYRAEMDAQGGACASIRARSRFSPAPLESFQRTIREREIRACLAEMRTDNPAAWHILRERDPKLFRRTQPSDFQIDGVTEQDIRTALDAAAPEQAQRGERPLIPALVLFLMMGLLVVLYFLPSLTAASRGHHNRAAIFALNLLLGWTFLGWVAALVWSLTAPRAPSHGREPA
jgi:hypothetical protein